MHIIPAVLTRNHLAYTFAIDSIVESYVTCCEKGVMNGEAVHMAGNGVTATVLNSRTETVYRYARTYAVIWS